MCTKKETGKINDGIDHMALWYKIDYKYYIG